MGLRKVAKTGGKFVYVQLGVVAIPFLILGMMIKNYIDRAIDFMF